MVASFRSWQSPSAAAVPALPSTEADSAHAMEMKLDSVLATNVDMADGPLTITSLPPPLEASSEQTKSRKRKKKLKAKAVEPTPANSQLVGGPTYKRLTQGK